MPVIRIDNPAFVFSSADPEVAAGVQSWLGQLKFPHDKFGNFKGPGFVGSFRPDSVNKQLIAYLATYLNGKRLVAITPGQASSLGEAQNQARNQVVTNILQGRKAPTSQPATPPGTGTNGKENVPNLGGKPGTGSGPGTGTTTGTGTSGGSGTTTTSPTPGGGIAVPAPGGFHVVSQSVELPKTDQDVKAKPFTPEERSWIDETIPLLPETFSNRVFLARVDTIPLLPGSPPGSISLGLTTSRGSGTAVTQLDDDAEKVQNDPLLMGAWPKPPYTDEQIRKLQFEATLAHELTHAFIAFHPGEKFYGGDAGESPILLDWAAKVGWKSTTGNSWCMTPGKENEIPTLYSITSPEEDLAESVKLYCFDPERLKRATPARYNFIRDTLGIKERSIPWSTVPIRGQDPAFEPLKDRLTRDGKMCK
ncbi:MAG: hypothetical protein HY303_14070 [Candidatus Wallbacteria bacterium]|nr:hypothetical protein [Candidatus Wallbacteria bacterium]